MVTYNIIVKIKMTAPFCKFETFCMRASNLNDETGQ